MAVAVVAATLVATGCALANWRPYPNVYLQTSHSCPPLLQHAGFGTHRPSRLSSHTRRDLEKRQARRYVLGKVQDGQGVGTPTSISTSTSTSTARHLKHEQRRPAPSSSPSSSSSIYNPGHDIHARSTPRLDSRARRGKQREEGEDRSPPHLAAAAFRL